MKNKLLNESYVISSDDEGICSCYSLVAKYRNLLNLQDEKYFAFQTILLEAVQNAICHGNKFNSELKVFLKIEVTENDIVLKVEDQGSGFDYQCVKNPIEACNLAKESGRGIYFIKQLADKCDFSDKGNCITVTLNIS